MSNYTTVRIDYDTMYRLEKIIVELQENNLGKISKALAIKCLVDEEYNRLLVREENSVYMKDNKKN